MRERRDDEFRTFAAKKARLDKRDQLKVLPKTHTEMLRLAGLRDMDELTVSTLTGRDMRYRGAYARLNDNSKNGYRWKFMNCVEQVEEANEKLIARGYPCTYALPPRGMSITTKDLNELYVDNVARFSEKQSLDEMQASIDEKARLIGVLKEEDEEVAGAEEKKKKTRQSQQVWRQRSCKHSTPDFLLPLPDPETGPGWWAPGCS